MCTDKFNPLRLSIQDPSLEYETRGRKPALPRQPRSEQRCDHLAAWAERRL